MSFYRIAEGEEERGRGLPSKTEEGYTCLFLSLAMTLLVGARDELGVLFKGLVPDQVEAEAVSLPAAPFPEPSGNEFYVGESRTVHDDGTIRLEVTRNSEVDLTVVFYDVLSSQPVLRRHESEEEGGSLEWFDPFFWSVSIDGAPASERSFTEMEKNGFAFRVDPETRQLLFKTR